MEKDEIVRRLTSVFRDVFDDETIQLSEEMTAKDIDTWDSLMHITLVVSVEKEFGVKLNAGEIGKLKNVGEMLSLLAERASL
ncbi:MAG TPA: acyl carrier protein [Elusimicrobia bacterium]|nr:acyl carrier protein [Elusimicrobiota bacterium]